MWLASEWLLLARWLCPDDLSDLARTLQMTASSNEGLDHFNLCSNKGIINISLTRNLLPESLITFPAYVSYICLLHLLPHWTSYSSEAIITFRKPYLVLPPILSEEATSNGSSSCKKTVVGPTLFGAFCTSAFGFRLNIVLQIWNLQGSIFLLQLAFHAFMFGMIEDCTRFSPTCMLRCSRFLSWSSPTAWAVESNPSIATATPTKMKGHHFVPAYFAMVPPSATCWFYQLLTLHASDSQTSVPHLRSLLYSIFTVFFTLTFTCLKSSLPKYQNNLMAKNIWHGAVLRFLRQPGVSIILCLLRTIDHLIVGVKYFSQWLSTFSIVGMIVGSALFSCQFPLRPRLFKCLD